MQPGGNRTTPLCFTGFALLYSAQRRTALYAAEHLTRASIDAARAIPRSGRFHPEAALPAEDRAELADYAYSLLDRGHLAPEGDMPSAGASHESFSLANIVPQAPSINRGVWEGIERRVRAEAWLRGSLYVVTGPAFMGADVGSVGQVSIPTHLWKAIYDPARKQAGAYIVENVDGARVRQISLVDLARMTGVEVWPGLWARTMRLPGPMRRRSSRGPEPGPRLEHARLAEIRFGPGAVGGTQTRARGMVADQHR